MPSAKNLPAIRTLLQLPTEQAEAVFQRLTPKERLNIIEATPDPKQREELYYLVPDAEELVQSSSVENLVEVIAPYVGTGLACGFLSAVTPDQFAQLFRRTAVRNGAVQRETAHMWLAELTELEPEQLTGILDGLDTDTLADLLRGRIQLPGGAGALMLDVGLISLENIDFQGDEQAYMVADLLYMSDPDAFLAVIRTLAAEIDDPPDTEDLAAGGQKNAGEEDDPPNPLEQFLKDIQRGKT